MLFQSSELALFHPSMAARNTTSMRVLTRPNSSSAPTTSSSASLPSLNSLPPLPDPPSSSTPSGVVVVGFISRRPDDSSQLINRVLDSNVFGSGNLHKLLRVENEEVKDWFKSRRFCYYHDEEKGILFLQFCSTRCPAMDGFSDSYSGFDSAVEEREFGDLQGLLFMFSVCHVIVYVQEGSRFDIQNLKTFRVLQSAKHALASHVKSRIAPPSTSRPHASVTPSNNPSPGRGGGMLSRNVSGISLMSGLGSYTSFFPGQCTPVTLFVFIDDFSDVSNVNSNVEESTDTPPTNHSSSSSSLARPSLPTKGSGSVVVLARPASKSEGGFRKKLQASLEAQIRFLIKKCRTLASSESNNTGSRSGGVSSSAPLFSLDASRAVVLLDHYSNQRGESLEFAAGLVVDLLNGKATSDTFLLETHRQSANKEDILSVKEFIYRQCDILRGRGGLVNNSNTGSAAGMVAVAAAAAAASVASVKTSTTPELPSLEIWLGSSQLIIQGVLTAKRGCIDETETSKRKPRQRNMVPSQSEGIASRGMDPLDIAVSLLESGKGLNTKFSTLWCQRALPAAKEVYLKDLPACYPTLQHEEHLEKALHAFHSMVKGPAVQLFVQKLQDECTSIWRSGRQLCDAVSLTGKPCMHQRHDFETGDSLSAVPLKAHSSGFVFLHACACGRSRRLRSDPFDFETANITSSCFPECDKLLPSLKLPNVNNDDPIRTSSWSLIRVGGMRYYEPSKGLLQSGFCPTERFLLKWTIFLEKRQNLNSQSASALQQGSVIRSSTDPKVDLSADMDMKKAGAAQLYSEELQGRVGNQKKPLNNIKNDNGDKKISFGRGLPNFNMRKPFSEVVAGSASADSGFPPLQQRKQPSLGSEKVIKQVSGKDRNREPAREIVDHQGSQKSEEAEEKINRIGANGYSDGDPLLQIGSNVVPVHVNGGENIKSNSPLKHVVVYVGFEHECPSGHRFLLNPQHLDELGSLYSLLEESQIPSSGEHLDSNLGGPSKFGKNGDQGKLRHNLNGRSGTAINKAVHVSKSGKERNQPSISVSAAPNVVKDIEQKLQSISLNDGGPAFCLLNRNIPLYMNCPHCKLSKNKKAQPKFKSAGTISQLQRIFVVTPPYPITLATCPVVQFEASCLPPTITDLKQKLQFNPGCQVVLPPESFVTLRLPFVYGVQLKDGRLFPINPFEHQPEATAWITKGTTLQVISKGSNIEESTPT